MVRRRPIYLNHPVDIQRDHILGNPDTELTLVEYGTYARPDGHAAHEVVASLRRRLGDRMRYVFRHRPSTDQDEAQSAAELAEYASETTGRFWDAHEALIRSKDPLSPEVLKQIEVELNLPPRDGPQSAAWQAARSRVQEDIRSAARSGAQVTPTFFINGRRFEGPWDESSLADAMLGSIGHRLRTRSLDFVRWAPSAGLLLLFASVVAVALTNSPIGSAFQSFWMTSFRIQLGEDGLALPLLDWVNHGLLSIFFLAVGLEIKRELTVGHLSTRHMAALPIMAAIGGIILPAIIYYLIVPSGPLAAGWGVPIATDTAFAVALIVLLGDRVPVELRVFLTAAVIIDDLVAIAVIALFYSGAIDLGYLLAAIVASCLLVGLNLWGVYGPLPHAILGLVLWVCLHAAGIHATLSGVILAIVTPTPAPANLRALMSQARILVRADAEHTNGVARRGPSAHALRALDAIHDRIESPADKLLRSIEPWSIYAVLPIFALANAGVVWSPEVFTGRGRLMLAIAMGLVIGKPAGIMLAAWLATRFGIAKKSDTFTWRQLTGASVLAGIGFTMSLFIAGEAFPNPGDYAAAKIAIFLASIVAGGLGVAVLFPSRKQLRYGAPIRKARDRRDYGLKTIQPNDAPSGA